MSVPSNEITPDVSNQAPAAEASSPAPTSEPAPVVQNRRSISLKRIEGGGFEAELAGHGTLIKVNPENGDLLWSPPEAEGNVGVLPASQHPKFELKRDGNDRLLVVSGTVGAGTTSEPMGVIADNPVEAANWVLDANRYINEKAGRAAPKPDPVAAAVVDRGPRPPREPRAEPPRPAPLPAGKSLKRLMDEEIGDDVAAALGQIDASLMTSTTDATTGSAAGAGPAPAAEGDMQRKTVRVLDIRGDHIYVDMGTKAEAVVPVAQFAGGKLPKPGELMEVMVDRYDPGTDSYTLRRPGASRDVDWGTMAKGMVVHAIVRGMNKGGLEVTVNGVRGFLPAGQVALDHIADLSQFMGKGFPCKVTEIDKASKKLVVSRKAVLAEEREAKAVELLAELEAGQVREGTVRKCTEFGAFVDLGGVDGLIHLSQLAWGRVDKAEDAVKPGQQVKVKVLSVNKETKKISLSLRDMMENPWKKAATKYRSGLIVSGKVIALLDAGAVIELEPGIEAFCHISEIAWRRVLRVNTALKLAQAVEVKIIDFEVDAQRSRVSIKQAGPEPVENQKKKPTEEELLVTAGQPTVKKTNKPLKGGGTGSAGSGGGLFSLPGKE